MTYFDKKKKEENKFERLKFPLRPFLNETLNIHGQNNSHVACERRINRN